MSENAKVKSEKFADPLICPMCGEESNHKRAIKGGQLWRYTHKVPEDQKLLPGAPDFHHCVVSVNHSNL